MSEPRIAEVDQLRMCESTVLMKPCLILQGCSLFACMHMLHMSFAYAMQRPNTNFKAAADTAVGAAMGKQQPSRNSQTQMMKNAGTGDMLAWLDAKIAAQKASLVG